MVTLADSFLQDLNDLDDEPEEHEDDRIHSRVGTTDEAVHAEEPRVKSEKTLTTTDVKTDLGLNRQPNKAIGAISNLSSQPDFIRTMEQVRRRTHEEPQLKIVGEGVEGVGEASEDPDAQPDTEYRLVETCNQLVTKLDIDIINIYVFVRDLYSKRFPELESIVFSPLEYIAVVQLIKNETDLTQIDLSNILPNTVTMAVTVASSMTTGHPLSLAEMDKVLEAGGEAMHLAECRKDVLIFLESRMNLLAPNISAIIGAALAARLITHAGGLVSLARMPAQNIMLVGSTGTTAKTGGSSSVSSSSSGRGIARGVIYNADLIQNTPPVARNRALKLVAGKVSLAARVDSFHESPSGDVGKALREKIVQSLIKAQEPPPAPLKKALPIPDDGTKHRRGGKRHRRAKEKYGLSEFRKQANRLTFGPEAEEEMGQDMGGAGFGMLGKGFGHGKLRLQAKQQKVQVKQQRRQQRKSGGSTTLMTGVGSAPMASGPTTGRTGGVSSSLVFTPLQGIELTNPDALIQTKVFASSKLEQDYFSSTTFS